MNGLIKIQESQIKDAALVISTAFYNDPPLVYSIPDGLKRREKSHYIFEAYVRYSVSYGEVYATSPDLEGIAVWLPSDKVDTNLWQDLKDGWFSVLFHCGPMTVLRQRNISGAMGAAHKHCISVTHRYLFFLGVLPELQGKGYAGALLRPVLKQADRDGLVCYLDNTKERNLLVYRHFGFEVVEEYKIPGTSIKLWAMLREPR